MPSRLHRLAGELTRLTRRRPDPPSRLGRGPYGVTTGALAARSLRMLRAWARDGR
jgi:hypothetical protein